MAKKYYSVVSSNKSGHMIANVIPCKSSKKPVSRYIRRLELHIDYFDNKAMAEDFAALLRG